MNCKVSSWRRQSWRAHRRTGAIFVVLVTLAIRVVGTVRAQEPKVDTSPITTKRAIGPRFMPSRKYHVNLRADFARGKNGDTFSMGMGESF